MNKNKKRLYLAAPLFSESEREYNQKLKSLLSRYFDVFLPQEDGQLFVDLAAKGMSIADAARRIFDCDVAAVQSSDILLIVMDGRSIDEGAAFELGLAYAIGKKCIALQTDPRRLLPIGNNPMIDSAVDCSFENIESLISWARSFSSVEVSSS